MRPQPSASRTPRRAGPARHALCRRRQCLRATWRVTIKNPFRKFPASREVQSMPHRVCVVDARRLELRANIEGMAWADLHSGHAQQRQRACAVSSSPGHPSRDRLACRSLGAARSACPSRAVDSALHRARRIGIRRLTRLVRRRARFAICAAPFEFAHRPGIGECLLK